MRMLKPKEAEIAGIRQYGCDSHRHQGWTHTGQVIHNGTGGAGVTSVRPVTAAPALAPR